MNILINFTVILSAFCGVPSSGNGQVFPFEFLYGVWMPHQGSSRHVDETLDWRQKNWCTVTEEMRIRPAEMA